MFTYSQSSTGLQETARKTLYILLSMLLAGLPTTRCDLTGYDCTDAITLFTIPFSNLIPSCKYDDIAISYSTTATLVHRNTSLKKLLVKHCGVRYNESAEGASHLMSAWVEEHIDRETCLKAHETEKLDLHGKIVDLDVTGTKQRLYMVDGKACNSSKNAKIRDYEITLSTYMALAEVSFNILRLEKSEVWCNYDDFQCDNNGEKLFWSDIEDCESDYASVFRGQVEIFRTLGGKTFATAEIQNYRFAFELSNLHPACSALAYKTQSNNWVVMFGEPKSIPNINFNIELFGDDLYFEKQADYRNSGINVVKRLCKADREILIDNFRNLEENYLNYMEPGLLRQKSGETLILKKCLPVAVRVRPTYECYERRLPIFDQFGREMFLTLKSRLIVDHAITIPCARKKLVPQKKPTSELEDSFTFITGIGLFCCGLWTLRTALGVAIKYFWIMIGKFRVVQPQRDEQTNDSKFRKLVNSFFVLIQPPFHQLF